MVCVSSWINFFKGGVQTCDLVRSPEVRAEILWARRRVRPREKSGRVGPPIAVGLGGEVAAGLPVVRVQRLVPCLQSQFSAGSPALAPWEACEQAHGEGG
jgi:hypothetical protein